MRNSDWTWKQRRLKGIGSLQILLREDISFWTLGRSILEICSASVQKSFKIQTLSLKGIREDSSKKREEKTNFQMRTNRRWEQGASKVLTRNSKRNSSKHKIPCQTSIAKLNKEANINLMRYHWGTNRVQHQDVQWYYWKKENREFNHQAFF